MFVEERVDGGQGLGLRADAVAAAVPVVDLRGVTRKAIGKTKPKGRGKATRTRRTEEVTA